LDQEKRQHKKKFAKVQKCRKKKEIRMGLHGWLRLPFKKERKKQKLGEREFKKKGNGGGKPPGESEGECESGHINTQAHQRGEGPKKGGPKWKKKGFREKEEKKKKDSHETDKERRGFRLISPSPASVLSTKERSSGGWGGECPE